MTGTTRTQHPRRFYPQTIQPRKPERQARDENQIRARNALPWTATDNVDLGATRIQPEKRLFSLAGFTLPKVDAPVRL